jgi:hypothetical protein
MLQFLQTVGWSDLTEAFLAYLGQLFWLHNRLVATVLNSIQNK